MSVRVSVIMPARNAERFIRAAVESVLAGSDDSVELVVVDDGSIDATAVIAKEAGGERVRVVTGPRKGISAAMNAGVEEARGEFIARCDADDLFVGERLKRQAAWLSEHPEFVAICGKFVTMDEGGRLACELECGAKAEEVTGDLNAGKTRTHLCTYLIRREILRKIGGFRVYFETAEDIDVQYRLAEAGRVWYEPVVGYWYRLHDASITHAGPDARREFFEQMTRRMQVQRRESGTDDVELGRAPEPPAKDQGASGRSAGEHVSKMLVYQAWQEHRAGRHARAVRVGVRACWARPGRLEVWRNLALLAIKRPAVSKNSLGEHITCV